MPRIKVVMPRIGSRDETDQSRDFWESSAVDAGYTALRRVKIDTIGTIGKPLGESVTIFRETEIVVGNRTGEFGSQGESAKFKVMDRRYSGQTTRPHSPLHAPHPFV